jgi:predicted glycoside hydrolase/deacetylase ChbG (UPF0249 family)
MSSPQLSPSLTPVSPPSFVYAPATLAAQFLVDIRISKATRGASLLIVTADDFGLSPDVNAAIIEAFDRRLVTHASLMANMSGFEQACELAHERRLLHRVGVHLNLTEGTPLTTPIRSCGRFCDREGRFRYWRAGDRAFHLGRVEREAVACELRAQIVRCRERGLPAVHLDSHHNVHNKRAIGRIVVTLARELGISRVRLAHNCGDRIGLVNRTYKAPLNRRLRRAGLAGTRWYGSAEDYRYLKASGTATASLNSFEMNVHPILRNGLLTDLAHPEHSLEQLLDSLDLVLDCWIAGRDHR